MPSELQRQTVGFRKDRITYLKLKTWSIWMTRSSVPLKQVISKGWLGTLSRNKSTNEASKKKEDVVDVPSIFSNKLKYYGYTDVISKPKWMTSDTILRDPSVSLVSTNACICFVLPLTTSSDLHSSEIEIMFCLINDDTYNLCLLFLTFEYLLRNKLVSLTLQVVLN